MKNTFAAKIEQFSERLLTGTLTYRTQENFTQVLRKEFAYEPNEHKTHIVENTLYVVRYNHDVWGKEWVREINGFADGYLKDVITIKAGTEVLVQAALSFGDLWLIGEHEGEKISISVGSHVLNKGYWSIIG